MVEFKINPLSNIPKFRQLVDNVVNALAENKLHAGDQLPSVNFICKEYKLSRDTVFKAYSILKDQGVIESVPNKGYFISNEGQKVLLFLDTLKAYKEVLYGEFVKNLQKTTIADVHFHHYNIDVFRKLINESKGRYSKYIIMPFDHPEVADIVNELPSKNTLIIDWDTNASNHTNKLFQNFGQPVYKALEDANHLLSKYSELIAVYPEFTNHPRKTIDNFVDFCKAHKYQHAVLEKSDDLDVKSGQMYFSVSDRMLGRILEQCKEKKLIIGENVGILSYNETPMKKFIDKGISVISTDFKLMGQKAAEFASSDISMDLCVPTKIFFRDSL